MLLKKSKLYDKEIAKLQGQGYILEQQKSLIENSKFDKETFEAMKAAKNAVDANRKNLDIDEMDKIKDEIADQLADASEVNDYFADAAQEGLDEAYDELDDMLNEEALKEMEGVMPGMAQIPSNPIPSANAAKPQPAVA